MIIAFYFQHTTRGDDPLPVNWVVVPGSVVVRDKTEKKTNIHDEKEERLETEETKHLKNFTNDVSCILFK